MDATPIPKTAQEHIIILQTHTHTQTHTSTVQTHTHINTVSTDSHTQPAVGPPPSVTPDEGVSEHLPVHH